MEGPDDNAGPRGPLFTSRRMERSREQRRRLVLGVVAVLILALGAGGWWWTHRSGAEAPPTPTVPSASSEGPDTAATRTAEQPIDLPPLDASDEVVRRSVAGLSSRPEWAAWLVSDDMIRRFVVAVVAVAEGRTPEAQLRFLVPKQPFAVREEGGRTVVDPQSYHRYDVPTATFVSLDTDGVARLYRQMHPLIEDAYRELGLPDRTFDETLSVAVRKLLTASVSDTPLEVEQQEGVYVYTDPDVEALSPADKQLLRLGPENARRLQAKLRELAAALGVLR